MPKIIVLGAGVSGLAAGLLLCRDGHDVTVLERDEGPVPSTAQDAWDRWGREGVVQFRQAHYLTPRGHEVLSNELPDVRAALEAAGAPRFEPLRLMSSASGDGASRPGDERFVTLAARRATFEQVLASAAQNEAGLEIRRGTPVTGLATRRYDGVPHVTGVRLESGDELTADLVVDAMGRGSRLPRWLAAAGAAQMHEEAEDSGFLYYSRFFRARDERWPDMRAPMLTEVGTFSVLTIPSDNATWSVTLYASAGDQGLKRMRDPDVWSAVVAACPLHAQWLDGEPLTDVMAMGGIMDRYRRPMRNGAPVVTGLALVGDAWACTNPSLGRGMTLALVHAAWLRDVVGSRMEDPLEFAQTWDTVTENELTPWYRETVEEDRGRLRHMTALRAGRAPEPPTGQAALRLALLGAVGRSPDAFRGYLANRSCLRLQSELWEDPVLAECIQTGRDAGPPVPFPGPDREQLLALMGEAVPAA